jgi:hypothetical protein
MSSYEAFLIAIFAFCVLPILLVTAAAICKKIWEFFQ